MMLTTTTTIMIMMLVIMFVTIIAVSLVFTIYKKPRLVRWMNGRVEGNRED